MPEKLTTKRMVSHREAGLILDGVADFFQEQLEACTDPDARLRLAAAVVIKRTQAKRRREMGGLVLYPHAMNPLLTSTGGAPEGSDLERCILARAATENL